jgi:hypothetical protein
MMYYILMCGFVSLCLIFYIISNKADLSKKLNREYTAWFFYKVYLKHFLF